MTPVKLLIGLMSLLAVAATVLTGAPLFSVPAISAGVGDELLPDLVTLTPRDLDIVTVRVRGNTERRLRLSNEIQNIGAGPLELFPLSQGCVDVRKYRKAFQRVFLDSNGNGVFERGVDTAATVYDAGCTLFHQQHHHWHFDELASYVLKGTNNQVVAGSTKVSFCIIDVHHRVSPPGSPANAYYTQCGRDSTLGISIGWSDEYHATQEGQYISITGVPDGNYCLVSTADPANRLRESNDANNAAGIQVALSGNTVIPGASCL